MRTTILATVLAAAHGGPGCIARSVIEPVATPAGVEVRYDGGSTSGQPIGRVRIRRVTRVDWLGIRNGIATGAIYAACVPAVLGYGFICGLAGGPPTPPESRPFDASGERMRD